MIIKLRTNTVFVFDLDDTLFPEIEYLTSAFSEISEYLSERSDSNLLRRMLQKYAKNEDVFGWLVATYRDKVPELTVSRLLQMYRQHKPVLNLSQDVKAVLDELKGRNIPLGLITDGRSLTQRSKLHALGILNYFTDIIISEEFGSAKPDRRNYQYFVEKYKGADFYFVGDNTAKDFIVPKLLGWKTICLKDCGTNVHKQNLSKNPPDIVIENFKEIVFL